MTIDNDHITNRAAEGFAAMGSGPRLQLLQVLIKAGSAGLPVGRLQARLDMPLSTLAHHLKILVGAGLVIQKKQGRSIINQAAFSHLEALAEYILKECCSEAEEASNNE